MFGEKSPLLEGESCLFEKHLHSHAIVFPGWTCARTTEFGGPLALTNGRLTSGDDRLVKSVARDAGREAGLIQSEEHVTSGDDRHVKSIARDARWEASLIQSDARLGSNDAHLALSDDGLT